MRLLNNAHSAGVTIITIVVSINAQGLLLGTLSAIIPQAYVQCFALRDCMQTVIQEQGNACLFVLELMTFMET